MTRPSGPRALAPALVLALALSGCSFLAGDAEDGSAGPGEAATPLVEDAERLDAALADLLADRARAVRRGDTRGFLAQTTDDAEGQRRYVSNLERLPVGGFTYELQPGTASVDVDGLVTARVLLRMRLQPFDAVPVGSEREMTFRVDEGAADADGTESVLLVSDEPVGPDPSNGGAQPWDTGALTVREVSGVLGLFDPADDAAAAAVVDATVAAAEVVADIVPVDWSGDVVVYAPADVELLSAIAGLPGGVADRLDGVAFSVRSLPDGRTAAERVVLHPRMLVADDVERDRLLRHELVHVALGPRDDRVPRWLSEGIAEWVSVQPLAPEDRLISAEALDAAREGVDTLPGDATFNAGPRSGANYGLAWQACEEIAATFGDDALWLLLDAMADRGDRTPERVLRRVLDMSSDEIATAAGERIVAAYG